LSSQAVADKLEQKSLVAQIHNFGQTPAQLFRRKHPKRAPLLPSTLPLLLQPKGALRLTMIGAPQRDQTVAALVHLAVTEGRVVAVGADRTFASHRWITPNSSAAGTFTFTSSPASPGLPYAIDGDAVPPRRVTAPLAVSSAQSSQPPSPSLFEST